MEMEKKPDNTVDFLVKGKLYQGISWNWKILSTKKSQLSLAHLELRKGLIRVHYSESNSREDLSFPNFCKQ